jgi:hypothetical protein
MKFNPQQFLQKTNPWVLLIVIIIIGLAVYLLYEKLKPASNTNANSDLVAQTVVDNSNLTYSTDALNAYVTKLFNALNDAALIGCDNATVLSVFQDMGSADDIKYLIVQFGTKDLFLNGQATNFFTKLLSPSLNLYGWLSSECNSSTITAINEILSGFNLGTI